MKKEKELPIYISGYVPKLAWGFCMPNYFLLRGSFGRYLMGVSALAWCCGIGFVWVAIDNAIFRWVFGQWEVTSWFTKYAILTIALAIFNSIEISFRKWDEDPIFATSPGESRLWIWDWIVPERFGNQETATRFIEPLIVGIATVFIAPIDAVLGVYLFSSGLVMFGLGNFLYVDARHTIKGIADGPEIAKMRSSFIAGNSSDEIEIDGMTSSAITERVEEAAPDASGVPKEFASIDLPRAYLSLPTSLFSLLSVESLTKIYGTKKIRTCCPKCNKSYVVSAGFLKRRTTCRACQSRFVITDAA